MANVFQTSSTYRAPQRAMTIKALQERHQAATEAAMKSTAIQQPIGDMWQGLAHLTGVMGAGLQESRAASAENAARDQLAQIQAGIDPLKGATGQQQADIYRYDPELGRELSRQAAEIAAREDEQQARADEAGLSRDFTRSERLGGQEFQSQERLGGQEFTTSERLAGESFQDRQRYAAAGLEDKRAQLNQSLAQNLITPEQYNIRMSELAAEAKPDMYGPLVKGSEIGLTGQSAEQLFQQGADGQWKQVGAGGDTYNIGNDSSADLAKEMAKIQSKLLGDYLREGNQASSMASAMDVIDALAGAPQGPLAGRLAQMFPGFNDQASAWTAIVEKFAPTQRVEGSGSTSDIEYQGMLKALPNLRNNPEANRLIAQVVRAQAQKSMARSAAVIEWQNSPKTREDEIAMNNKLREIDNAPIMDDRMRQLIRAAGGEGGPTPTPGTANQDDPLLKEDY